MIHHITMCTVQIELMDSDMVEYAIDMVHELDRTYGFPPKRTLSQVPVTEHGTGFEDEQRWDVQWLSGAHHGAHASSDTAWAAAVTSRLRLHMIRVETSCICCCSGMCQG